MKTKRDESNTVEKERKERELCAAVKTAQLGLVVSF